MVVDSQEPDAVQPDPSANAETVALNYLPEDTWAVVSPGGVTRRRIAVISGVAVLAVASIVGALSLGSGSGSHTAATSSRQDSQLGDGNGTTRGDQALGAAGQASSQQGGGGPAAGTPATPSSLSSTGAPSTQDGSTTSAPTNPAQPHSSASPSKAGQSTNPIAPSSTLGQQPTAPPSAPARTPAYGGRLASGAANSSATSVKLQTSGASSNGDTLLLSVMLTNTHSGGVVASDSAGNSYSVVADQSDGADDRTLILAAVGARALGGGGSVTVTFPATLEHHVALDDFSGVTGISGHSSATAASGPFASGSAAGSGGIAFGVAGVQGGANATWSAGFTALPTLFVSADQLATAYEGIGSGGVQASGFCDHQWMAAAVTLAG